MAYALFEAGLIILGGWLQLPVTGPIPSGFRASTSFQFVLSVYVHSHRTPQTLDAVCVRYVQVGQYMIGRPGRKAGC